MVWTRNLLYSETTKWPSKKSMHEDPTSTSMNVEPASARRIGTWNVTRSDWKSGWTATRKDQVRLQWSLRIWDAGIVVFLSIHRHVYSLVSVPDLYRCLTSPSLRRRLRSHDSPDMVWTQTPSKDHLSRTPWHQIRVFLGILFISAVLQIYL